MRKLHKRYKHSGADKQAVVCVAGWQRAQKASGEFARSGEKQTRILSKKSGRTQRSSINGCNMESRVVCYVLNSFDHILDRRHRLFIGLDKISGLVNVMNRLKRHKVYLQFEQKGSQPELPKQSLSQLVLAYLEL